MCRISTVILLGGHIQALELAREAYSAGCRVMLIVEDRWSVASFSKCVAETRTCQGYGELDELIMGEAASDRNTLIFPTNDDMVLFLDRNRKRYEPHFILGIPDSETIDVFNDKRNADEFCRENGIPHPESFCVHSIDELRRMVSSVRYPVIVKPAVMYSFHRIFGQKAFRCNSSEDLCSVMETLSRRYPIEQLIVQELIEGGPSVLYSYGVFSVDGVPKVWTVANRIRQNPMDFGNSTTFAYTCDINEIREMSEKILRLRTYTGLAEIEYMYDARTDTHKFLEVNTRAWKWIGIGRGLGSGFFSAMIKHFNSEDDNIILSAGSAIWQDRLTDYAVIIKGLLRGCLSLRDVLSRHEGRKTYACWSWYDPLPAMMYLLMSPVLYFKRH